MLPIAENCWERKKKYIIAVYWQNIDPTLKANFSEPFVQIMEN